MFGLKADTFRSIAHARYAIVKSLITIALIRSSPILAAASCPDGTKPYTNATGAIESCYLFLNSTVTERMNRHVLKLDPALFDYPNTDKSKTVEADYVRLAPCVWDRAQAERICREIHKVPKYANLASYSLKWHLPIIDSQHEDDWLNAELNQLNEKFGIKRDNRRILRVWIDLVRIYERREWKSRPKQEVKHFHRPMGIDRWWERANVIMKRREDSEVMCYEYHIDYYNDNSERDPQAPMYVRGFQPRACFGAYDQVSPLDHPADWRWLTIKAEEGRRNVWPPNPLVKCTYYHCAIPAVPPPTVVPAQKDSGGVRHCGIPPVWVSCARRMGCVRMRHCPIAVACEFEPDGST